MRMLNQQCRQTCHRQCPYSCCSASMQSKQSKRSNITQTKTTYCTTLVNALATCPVDRYKHVYGARASTSCRHISTLLHTQQPNADRLQRMQCFSCRGEGMNC